LVASSLLGLLVTGCAAAIGAGGEMLTFRVPDDTTMVEGTLVEARCFLNTGAIAEDHTFCAFSGARANLPLAIVTARGDLVFLTSAPAKLSAHVTRPVRVNGFITPNRQLMRPKVMQVHQRGSWVEVAM
jgi:hypothetical protein